MALANNNVQVVGYEDPALEGESITFTCPFGLELSGSSSSTCMGDGEWEPYPREVNCMSHVKLQPTDPVICGYPHYVLQFRDSITITTYEEFRNSDFNSSRICCSGIAVIEANTINCLEEDLNTIQLRYEGKCQLVSCIILPSIVYGREFHRLRS